MTHLEPIIRFFLEPLGAAAVVAAVVVGMGLAYLALGRGPRRWRALRRAQRLTRQGDWRGALAAVRAGQALSRAASEWQERLRHVEGSCWWQAAEQALQERQFEDSAERFHRAARLWRLEEADSARRVSVAMRAEVRRLFAETPPDQPGPVLDMITRLLLIETPCPEAWFWQALCQARQGQIEQAVNSLNVAVNTAEGPFVDPLLYRGILLMWQGQLPEALRSLAEAHRLAADCPFVSWQLGLALSAAQSDANLAARALQRALGPQGLPRWLKTPEKVWSEGFPDVNRSYVRRLAEQHRFVCPVLGTDVAGMIRQGMAALAQARYRLGQWEEAAAMFLQLMQSAAPTAGVLRGLGLALARLDRFDEAFKHLRAAHELENPKDPWTAGYLALCAARGTPIEDADKPRNIAWGVQLVSRFTRHGDADWAELCGRIFTEARLRDVPLSLEDQQWLVATLLSVAAADPLAAAAYDHLAATAPDAVPNEAAWLYCQACAQHSLHGRRDQQLFDQTFGHVTAARQYFEQHGWDFGAVEFLYLQRWAAARPGGYPPLLGPEYPPRGACVLRAYSRQLEEQDRFDEAIQAALAWQRLEPVSSAPLDQLAYLSHRQGDREAAVDWLRRWHDLQPGQPLPLLRQAVIEQERGRFPQRDQALSRALAITAGEHRAEVAFLGARLVLAEVLGAAHCTEANEGCQSVVDILSRRAAEVTRWLEETLRARPNHVAALWCLAAVRWLAGDRAGVAALAESLNHPEVDEPRLHVLAALCQLVAGDFPQVLLAAARAVSHAEVAADSRLLAAWSYLYTHQTAHAKSLLIQVVAEDPSADSARALLAQLCHAEGDLAEAVRWWQGIAEQRRRQWQLDAPLTQTWLLAGVSAYEQGQYQQAANAFRQAEGNGTPDPYLRQLAATAWFRMGQRLLYGVARTSTHPDNGQPMATEVGSA